MNLFVKMIKDDAGFNGFDKKQRADTGDNNGQEQPSFIIKLHNIGAFIDQKAKPFLKFLLFFGCLTALISLLFALYYDGLKHEEVDFVHTWRDSFLIFENLPIFTDNGQPMFLIPNKDITTAQELLNSATWVMLIERIVGLLLNGILISCITAIALQPINPLWVAPRFVYDYTRGRYGALVFRYWIRYPEDDWLHRFVLTLRMLTDDADRSIEIENETSFETKVERIMRRGTLEFAVPLSAKHGALLEVLTKMYLATYRSVSGVSDSYTVWSAKRRELISWNPDDKDLEDFSNDMQINFRVAGTMDDANEVAREKRFKTTDLLVGYRFLDAEVPVEYLKKYDKKRAPFRRLEELLFYPGHRANKYHYIYENVWRVVKTPRGYEGDKWDKPPYDNECPMVNMLDVEGPTPSETAAFIDYLIALNKDYADEYMAKKETENK